MKRVSRCGITTKCVPTKRPVRTIHDAAVGPQLLAGEDKSVRVLADSAYGTGESEPHQSSAATIDDFTVDDDNCAATCPHGLTRPIRHTGIATFGVACLNCPVRCSSPPIRCCTHHGSATRVVGQPIGDDRAAPEMPTRDRVQWKRSRLLWSMRTAGRVHVRCVCAGRAVPGEVRRTGR